MPRSIVILYIMKTIEIRWSTGDVLMKAEEMDIELTEEQADIILDNIERYHDACVGINWDVIDYHIETYVMEKNV